MKSKAAQLLRPVLASRGTLGVTRRDLEKHIRGLLNRAR